MNELIEKAKEIAEALNQLDLDSRVDALNAIRRALAEASPFNQEPVDCIVWVRSGRVHSNDYNPNKVAPPEMQLLEHSISCDGYTQPIVAWENDGFEVIDGFHRHRVGKESEVVRERVKGFLPLAVIREDRKGRNDRIASTIRHNRARGKHGVNAMSDIVIELKKRNWTDARIAKELGMDEDEVLRLCQVSGLAEVFDNEEFSQAWEAAIFSDDDIDDLTEEDIQE